MKEKKEIDIFQNELVPKHELLNDDEKAKLLEDYKITIRQLPRIKEDDPAIAALNTKKDDVIKITRKSPSAGAYIYYRAVVSSKK
ncbi:MAG: DNA-directed RNA polymerase subunit H [Candidatus Aenigmatarchaeota archaeon]